MASSLSNKFGEVISKYLDYDKLCTEGNMESTFDGLQKRKKVKYNPQDINSEKVLELLINDTLKKYMTKSNTSYSDVLDHQIVALVELYENKCSYNVEMQKVLTFVKLIISEKILSQHEIFTSIRSIIHRLPFNFVWRLTKLEIFSLEKFINRIKESESVETAIDHILVNLEQLIFKDAEDNSASDILNDTLLTLIRISYELKSAAYQNIQTVSNKLLSGIMHKLLKRIDNEAQSPQQFINIYDVLLLDNSLHDSAVKQFAANELVGILTFEPEMRLTYAIEQQSKWRSTSFNKDLSSVVLSLVKIIGCEDSFSTLDNVVSSLEVSWSKVLTFLGTLLLAYPHSSAKLKEVIDNYIRKGNETQESEFLILGFLYARHASMEGRHVFPPYPQWFAATFGSESSSPANNKQAFVFMMKFLTSLVPYDSALNLRAHICQSIFVPKGCQSVLRDYQRMAKCRLQDLNEETDGISSNKTGFRECKISADVDTAVAQFNQAGKVPSFVLEAAIFRRQYFISSFLPLLLTPRHLPLTADARMKLIAELNTLGNIPEKVYKTYQEKCKEMKRTPVTMEIDNQTNFDPSRPPSYKDYLKQYLEMTQSTTQSMTQSMTQSIDDSRDSKCMQLLSTLTQSIEETTSHLDQKLTNDASLMVVNTCEFNPDEIQYQVIVAVFDTIKSLLELENCPFINNRVRQLVLLLASTPSLQLASIVCFIKACEKVGEKKNFTTKEVKFYGVLLSEVSNHSGMFLPMRLATSVNVSLSNVEDILLESIPLQDPEFFLFNCCLLQNALDWNTNFAADEPSNSGRPKKLMSLYFFVSSRLVAMKNDSMIRSEVRGDMVNNFSSDYLPVFAGTQIPKCCQFLINNAPKLIEEIALDDWINFELDCPWGDTTLSARVKHLQHWAQHFLNPNERSSSADTSEQGFLLLFWKLIKAGSYKRNSSEMFILLQSLSLRDPAGVCLLDEWKRWKKTLSAPRSIPAEESEDSNQEYQTMLSDFISLCHSLSPAVVCGRNARAATLGLFNEFVADLMVMEGRIFLSMKDTLLLLECFLRAVRKVNPPSSHLQNCFTLLKESVLFHHQAMVPLLKRNTDITDKYLCLQYLLRINVNNPPSYKSLPDEDIGILLSSRLNSDPRRGYEGIPHQYRGKVFPYLVSLLGRHLVKNGYFFNYNREKLSGNCEDERIELFVESASEFLSTLEPSSNPSVLLASWKEVSSASLFWKLFLLGFSHLLLMRLDKTIDNSSKLMYTFLLLVFKFLSSFFEENPGDNDLPLSYLSHMAVKINSFTKILPVKMLKLISESVLSDCDKELVALIRYRCTE